MLCFPDILLPKIKQCKGMVGVKCKRVLSTRAVVRTSGCCRCVFSHWLWSSLCDKRCNRSSTLSCLLYSLASLPRQSSRPGCVETHFSVAQWGLDLSTLPNVTWQVWVPEQRNGVTFLQWANVGFLIHC